MGFVNGTKLRVPLGEGVLIGDILRKYVTRMQKSWQPIGYYVNSTAENFGFSDGAMSSYLELLKGMIVSPREDTETLVGTTKMVDFTWDGENFVGDGLYLTGVSRAVGETVRVCVMFASGHRTADQNWEILRRVADNNAEGFIAVPSPHSVTQKFRYKVEPIDSAHEWLILDANMNHVQSAADHVIRTLSSLNL